MERYKQLIEIATDLFGGRMEETKELITTDDIRSKVYIIRGQQVIIEKEFTLSLDNDTQNETVCLLSRKVG